MNVLRIVGVNIDFFKMHRHAAYFKAEHNVIFGFVLVMVVFFTVFQFFVAPVAATCLTGP